MAASYRSLFNKVCVTCGDPKKCLYSLKNQGLTLPETKWWCIKHTIYEPNHLYIHFTPDISEKVDEKKVVEKDTKEDEKKVVDPKEICEDFVKFCKLLNSEFKSRTTYSLPVCLKKTRHRIVWDSKYATPSDVDAKKFYETLIDVFEGEPIVGEIRLDSSTYDDKNWCIATSRKLIAKNFILFELTEIVSVWYTGGKFSNDPLASELCDLLDELLKLKKEYVASTFIQCIGEIKDPTLRLLMTVERFNRTGTRWIIIPDISKGVMTADLETVHRRMFPYLYTPCIPNFTSMHERAQMGWSGIAGVSSMWGGMY